MRERAGGADHPNKPHAPLLPHYKLVVYGVAVELLLAVKAANIRDAKLRNEAVRAAEGTCLNCAEGAGRASLADKARVFAIARGEAVAAVEIAAHAGDTTPEHAERCVLLGHRLIALLTGLIRYDVSHRRRPFGVADRCRAARGRGQGPGSGPCSVRAGAARAGARVAKLIRRARLLRRRRPQRAARGRLRRVAFLAHRNRREIRCAGPGGGRSCSRAARRTDQPDPRK